MTRDFASCPPDVAGGDAEAERVSEAASAGKQPWAKPTIWIGRWSITNAGPSTDPFTENSFYYIPSA